MVPGSRPDRVRARSALYLQTTHALPANPPPRVLLLLSCAAAPVQVPNQMSPDPGPRVRATRCAAPSHDQENSHGHGYHSYHGSANLQNVNPETTCGAGNMRRLPL